MRKTAATTVLAAALAVSAAPTAHAEQAAVNYTATTTDKSMTIRTDGGSMGVEDGAFKIKDAAGTLLGGTELSFRVDDYVFPIAAEITDRTAVLTPQFDTEHAKYQPVAMPYEDQAPWKSTYEREQAAWNRMVTTISTGATIGTLVGGIGGAAVGCLLGGAGGAVLTGALSAMFGAVPGAIAGCVAGMSVVGFLGTLAGQLLITAPVAVLAAGQYFTTINSPFAAPK